MKIFCDLIREIYFLNLESDISLKFRQTPFLPSLSKNSCVIMLNSKTGLNFELRFQNVNSPKQHLFPSLKTSSNQV